MDKLERAMLILDTLAPRAMTGALKEAMSGEPDELGSLIAVVMGLTLVIKEMRESGPTLLPGGTISVN